MMPVNPTTPVDVLPTHTPRTRPPARRLAGCVCVWLLCIDDCLFGPPSLFIICHDSLHPPCSVCFSSFCHIVLDFISSPPRSGTNSNLDDLNSQLGKPNNPAHLAASHYPRLPAQPEPPVVHEHRPAPA